MATETEITKPAGIRAINEPRTHIIIPRQNGQLPLFVNVIIAREYGMPPPQRPLKENIIFNSESTTIPGK